MAELQPLSEIEKELYDTLCDDKIRKGTKIKDKVGRVYEILKLYKTAPDECYGIEFWLIGCTDEEGDLHRLVCEDWEDKFWSEYEIIGHEPTLNDVLLKLSRKWMVDLAPTQNGQSRIHLTAHDIQIFLYDISRSFDSQSEETKRKLHSLLTFKTL